MTFFQAQERLLLEQQQQVTSDLDEWTLLSVLLALDDGHSPEIISSILQTSQSFVTDCLEKLNLELPY